MFIKLNKLCEIRDSLHELQRYAVEQQLHNVANKQEYEKIRALSDKSYEPLCYLNAVIDEMTRHIVAEVE